jgi:hypothetical protein
MIFESIKGGIAPGIDCCEVGLDEDDEDKDEEEDDDDDIVFVCGCSNVS